MACRDIQTVEVMHEGCCDSCCSLSTVLLLGEPSLLIHGAERAPLAGQWQHVNVPSLLTIQEHVRDGGRGALTDNIQYLCNLKKIDVLTR
jgi:hypothetical protein